MKFDVTDQVSKLEDIPNIGKSIAADLRSIGIKHPQQLLEHEPLELYLKLGGTMGKRHDPCVRYTFMAARYYMQSGEKVAWWKFTERGKKLLSSYSSK
jgi:DNA transformation protein